MSECTENGLFEEQAHTADVRLAVCGADAAALFRHAGLGLMRLLRCEPQGTVGPVERHITLDAPDLETLLIDWLNELLYLAGIGQECYDVIEVRVMDQQHLEAMVQGRDHQPAGRDIKAATFSDLAIIHVDRGYEATITFDI
ncbi:MAG: archease [Anaerolineae bacterium]